MSLPSQAHRVIRPLRWEGGPEGCLTLVDQTQLPHKFVERTCRTVEEVWQAIRQLQVRGAPAIGIAAAYGVCVGLQPYRRSTREEFLEQLERIIAYLSTSRPTAVNLFWALQRMKARAAQLPATMQPEQMWQQLWFEAQRIADEDRQMCHAIGRHGASLLRQVHAVLTHCNTGGLATAEYGTALAIIFTAQDQGHTVHVYVDETRPLFQGARLTAWELMQRGIPTTLICDSMAAWVMRQQRVQAVLVGADRVAANGDTANKIGTYGLAVLAHAHHIPFYVAAPSSSFDFSLSTGAEIPIEERPATEVTEPCGHRIAPQDVPVYNPAFDVTPAQLITAIVTEHGVIQPVNESTIQTVLARKLS